MSRLVTLTAPLVHGSFACSLYTDIAKCGNGLTVITNNKEGQSLAVVRWVHYKPLRS